MPADQQRVLTIPNGITAIRAIGVPIFLWSYLGLHEAALSFIILAVGAITDYLDGKVARALNQTSSLGAAMDPTIDRLYIASTIIALAIRDVIPWQLVAILIIRDLAMALLVVIKKRRTGSVFEVTYLGKAATFNLLYAFPMFLLSGEHGIGFV
jgi:cardiolipin synthase